MNKKAGVEMSYFIFKFGHLDPCFFNLYTVQYRGSRFQGSRCRGSRCTSPFIMLITQSQYNFCTTLSCSCTKFLTARSLTAINPTQFLSFSQKSASSSLYELLRIYFFFLLFHSTIYTQSNYQYNDICVTVK